MTDLLPAALKRRDRLEPKCTTHFSGLIKRSHMPLITITHTLSQKLPLGEDAGEAHRTDAWWNIGRRPGIPVAGVAPETEQNGVRGKNIYNNPDENKVLGYYFILAAARTTIKAVRGKDCSFSKTVWWRLVMSCTHLKIVFKLTHCTLICGTVIHLCTHQMLLH